MDKKEKLGFLGRGQLIFNGREGLRAYQEYAEARIAYRDARANLKLANKMPKDAPQRAERVAASVARYVRASDDYIAAGGRGFSAAGARANFGAQRPWTKPPRRSRAGFAR